MNLPFSSRCLRCGPAKLQKYSSAQTSFLYLIEDLLERCDREDIEFLAVLAQKLWLRRNSLVHEGTFAHPSQVLRETKKSLEDFHRHNDKEGEHVGRLTRKSTDSSLAGTDQQNYQSELGCSCGCKEWASFVQPVRCEAGCGLGF
jgi:hypothetical protein